MNYVTMSEDDWKAITGTVRAELGTDGKFLASDIPARIRRIGPAYIDRFLEMDIEEIESGASFIPQYAFYQNKTLRGAVFGSASSVGVRAFYECSNLEIFEAPKVESLSAYALFGCGKVKKLDFDFLSSIGSYALYGCTGLESLVLRASRICALSSSGALSGFRGRIYVPERLLSSYKTASGWSSFAGSIYPLGDYPEVNE